MNDKLAQIRAEHQRQSEQDRQFKVSQLTASQISSLEESMLKSFQLLVKYLDGKTTKTEVVNQLKEVSTPDVDKVVRAVQTLTNTTSQNKIDLTDVKSGLKALEDQLKLIPKEKAEFEQREDVKVTNLSDIKLPDLDTSKLEKAIKELKIEAPVVNLPQTEVNVDAPDLKPLQKGLKDLLDGIKAIHIPEVPVTDLTKVEKKLDESNVKLQRLVDKPGPNLGPGTPYVSSDGTGKPVYVELTADGKVPVEAGATSTYQSFNDTTTDTNLVYLGKAVAGTDATDAAWQIKRYNKTAGTMTFADDITTFTKQWSARTGYTY